MTGSLPPYLFASRFFQILPHLPSFARLYWRLFRDRRVSILPKILLVLALLYVLSPFDVIPDLVPVVGEMDDVVIALGALWLFVRLSPPVVVRETVAAIVAEGRARG